MGGAEADLEVGVEKEVGTFKIGSTTYKRYVKVIDWGKALPNAKGQDYIDCDFTFTGIISLSAMATGTGTYASFILPIPYVDPASADVNGSMKGIVIISNKIYITVGSDSSGYNKVLVFVEYYR